MGRLRRLVHRLFVSDLADDEVRCPLCGGTVRMTRNWMPGPGILLRVPRRVEEIITSCTAQNGTVHAQADIDAAVAERPWRP